MWCVLGEVWGLLMYRLIVALECLLKLIFFSLSPPCRWLRMCVTLSSCLCCWMLGCWSVVWTQLCILHWSLTCWLMGNEMWRRLPVTSTRPATVLRPGPCSCPTEDPSQGSSPSTVPTLSLENGFEEYMWAQTDTKRLCLSVCVKIFFGGQSVNNGK